MWVGALIGLALVGAIIIGFGLVIGAPIWAVPSVVVILAGAAATMFGGRNALRKQGQIQRMKRFRRQAMPRKNEFDATDKQTLV